MIPISKSKKIVPQKEAEKLVPELKQLDIEK
jgi:hypothetical protein